MTEDRNSGEYGLPFDDETDGPDVARARQAYEESATRTDEVATAVEESRQLVDGILEIGSRNHFADKWKLIIARGSAA